MTTTVRAVSEISVPVASRTNRHATVRVSPDPVEHHGLLHRRGNTRGRAPVSMFAAVPDAVDPPLPGGWRLRRLRESHGGNDR